MPALRSSVLANRAETLLPVPQYDFNWQMAYRASNAGRVSAGHAAHHHRPLRQQPQQRGQPRPEGAIRWGEPSEEEMMSGWIEYIEAPANTALSSLTH